MNWIFLCFYAPSSFTRESSKLFGWILLYGFHFQDLVSVCFPFSVEALPRLIPIKVATMDTARRKVDNLQMEDNKKGLRSCYHYLITAWNWTTFSFCRMCNTLVVGSFLTVLLLLPTTSRSLYRSTPLATIPFLFNIRTDVQFPLQNRLLFLLVICKAFVHPHRP